MVIGSLTMVKDSQDTREINPATMLKIRTAFIIIFFYNEMKWKLLPLGCKYRFFCDAQIANCWYKVMHSN